MLIFGFLFDWLVWLLSSGLWWVVWLSLVCSICLRICFAVCCFRFSVLCDIASLAAVADLSRHKVLGLALFDYGETIVLCLGLICFSLELVVVLFVNPAGHYVWNLILRVWAVVLGLKVWVAFSCVFGYWLVLFSCYTCCV